MYTTDEQNFNQVLLLHTKKAIHSAIYITKICKTIEKVCQKPIVEKIVFDFCVNTLC